MDLETMYDFSDVLIKPVQTSIGSRSEVELEVNYHFKYSTGTLKCVPIMAANMDTVGTIGVMKELAQHNMFTCLHKFISLEEFTQENKFLNVKCWESMEKSGEMTEYLLDPNNIPA